MTLLVRTDADTAIGLGHFMRCLALAQSWKSGSTASDDSVPGDSQSPPAGQRVRRAIFAVGNGTPTDLIKRLTAEDIEVELIGLDSAGNSDARRTREIALSSEAAWCVLDGYHFDTNYQQAIAGNNTRWLVIDDLGSDSIVANAILNHNPYALRSMYSGVDNATCLLLGGCYTLLGKPFWQWRDYVKTISPAATRILVTMGGSDTPGMTERTVAALCAVRATKLSVTVILGSAYAHDETNLHDLVAGDGHIELSCLRNVVDMATLMAWADMAITATGSTCWEIAYMGLPALVIATARNQKHVARHLQSSAAARFVGWHDAIDEGDIAAAVEQLLANPDLRRRMSLAGRQTVPTVGNFNVVEALMRCDR